MNFKGCARRIFQVYPFLFHIVNTGTYENSSYIFIAFSCVFWGLSCSDTESVAQTAPVDVPEGLSFSSERPDADQPLTITFKAAKSSDLYGYKGDVYILEL